MWPNQRLDLTVTTWIDSVRVYVHGRSALTLEYLKKDQIRRCLKYAPVLDKSEGA